VQCVDFWDQCSSLMSSVLFVFSMISIAHELRSIMLVCRKSIGTIDGKNERL